MTKVVIGTVVAVVAIVGAIYYFSQEEPASAAVQEFAQCINDSGTTYYGAFWCPNCQEQEELFGTAKDQLPYVECSNPDRSQTEECIVAGIEAYPTWEFPNGERQTGMLPFEVLAARTGCPLPEER